MSNVIKNRVTCQDVANVLGLKASTVSTYLSNHSTQWSVASDERIEYVKKVAEDMGYVKRVRKPKSEKYWYGTIFRTREEMRKAMMELRNEGYGTKTIAQRCGVTMGTVIRNIGTEPVELAKHNNATAQHLRKARNMARAKYLREQKIREYNAAKAECNDMYSKIVVLEQRIQQMEKESKWLLAVGEDM